MNDLFRDLIEAAEATQRGERSGGTFGRLSLALDAIKADGGEYRPAYNGWPNRETWNTALWISNEQERDEAAREIVAEHMATVPDHWREEPTPYAPDIAAGVRAGKIANAAEALLAWWEEYATSLNPTGFEVSDLPGPVSDAWSHALAVTDWYSIAEGYAEEQPQPSSATVQPCPARPPLADKGANQCPRPR